MTPEDGRAKPPASEDHAYFRAIEETFIRLRGAPLLLSPNDWQVARRWRRLGVPLEVVCRGLETFFARRRERDAGGRVNSLRYCAPAVEEEWTRMTEIAAPGRVRPAAKIDVRARLERLAAAIPRQLPGSEATASEILRAAGDVAETEARLVELDRNLLAACRRRMSESDRLAIEEKVEQSLARLGGRLSAGERSAARERLLGQVLRRRLGLPVLSLFSPAAQAASEEPD